MCVCRECLCIKAGKEGINQTAMGRWGEDKEGGSHSLVMGAGTAG